MKELSLNKLENLEGGKFWGQDCEEWKTMGIGSGCATQTCRTKRFWFTTKITVERFCED